MRFSNVKPVIIGVSAAAVVIAITGAASGSGVGGLFNLGKSNTVNASTGLTGTARTAMLSVSNKGKGTALSLRVGKGRAPFSVNSSAQVSRLNASLLGGLAASQFVQGGGQSRSFGFSLSAASSQTENLLRVPGFGMVIANCVPGQTALQNYAELTFQDGTHTLDINYSVDASTGAVTVNYGELAPQPEPYLLDFMPATGPTAISEQLVLRYTTGSGHSLITHMATVSLMADINVTASPNTCDFDASEVTGPGVTGP